LKELKPIKFIKTFFIIAIIPRISLVSLIQIEQAEYILEEEKARLQYDKQLSAFNRYEALQDINLISVEEFETARLSLRQAELLWKQAKLNLNFTIVR
jgi:multidrug resistance efflux pump